MREKILNLLENNGRIDIHDMSVMLGVAQEEVANEIADMEKEHIICGYNTLINWDKTGDEKVTALIEVKVTQFVAAKLAPLDSVLSTSTHFVLKKYKDYGTVIDEEDKDERMLVTP